MTLPILRPMRSSSQADGHADPPPEFARQRRLTELLGIVEQALLEATVLMRGDGAPVSPDEQRHASVQAQIALALMDQEQARTVAEAETASVDAILASVALEQRHADDDHSARYALHQTADAMVANLRGYNLPAALAKARLTVLGIASSVRLVAMACQTCTHPLETREERLRGTCALCKWSDETGGVR